MAVGQQIAPIMAFPEAGILPPGWYVDSGGALRMEGWDTDLGQSRHTSYPHLTGVTTSTAQTAAVYKDGLYGGPFPEGTLGGAKISAAGGGTAPVWKNLYASIALTAGGITDQSLIAAVAGKRFDVVLGGVAVVAPVDATGVISLVLTYQDSANAAVAGMLTSNLAYKWDVTNSRFAGFTQTLYPWPSANFTTPTAGLALEVDVTGGAGTEAVVIWGRYREF